MARKTENGGKVINEGLYNYKKEYGGGEIVMPVYIKQIKGE